MGNERYFDFSVEDFKRHVNMISFTNTPIVVAVYERIKNTDMIRESQLFMFGIQELAENIEKVALVERKDVKGGKCYRIPVWLIKKGFKLLDAYKDNYRNSSN